MKRIDPLKYLARTDKWYLGGSGRLIWAPTFPSFLNRPGFWDEAHYFNIKIQPLFTWTLVNDRGIALDLRSRGRRWTPAQLTQRFECTADRSLAIVEQKVVLPNDVAAAEVTIRNNSRKKVRLHLVAWTAQESAPGALTRWVTNAEIQNNRVRFRKHVQRAERPEFACDVVFGIDRKIHSSSLNLSEGTMPGPEWQITPFFEKFNRRPSNRKITGVTDEGCMYAALHSTLTLRPGAEKTITVAMALGANEIEASQSLNIALKNPAVEMSRMAWTEYFSAVPFFNCSDEYLARYYWYRWYGLRLNTVRATEGNYGSPFVCEGIDYFRAPISYSAPCHVMENRWMHSPDLARGSVLTFVDNQREDGGFRGYIDRDFFRQEMPGVSAVEPIYHARWGRALLALESVHPSDEFLSAVYERLKKHAQYYDRERDEEVSGLYDIHNHYETGQEYMHRYTAVHPDADRANWGEVFRLKGVDVSVYVYELKRALGFAAVRLGMTEEAALWNLEAERIKAAILEKMWDPTEEMFFDVDPATGQQTKAKAATCFYPYLTDIVAMSHVPGLKRHLFSTKEFWTPFPVPSTSRDDETFSAEAEWKGKRMNCPWNGRVWPMTNSHMVEALARTASRFNDPMLRRMTATFISRFIRMMFFDQDPKRPNCFEHYNPITGTPSLYRGIDDYQHSWVVDLIIQYVCGIRPDNDRIVIDPMPFGLKHVVVDDVLVRDKRIKVEIRDKKFSVWIDGALFGNSVIGKPLYIADW